MDFNDRLARLKRLSPASLPRVIARRLAASGRLVLERALYTPSGPRRSPPKREIRPLGLLHPSVFAPGFREAFHSRFPTDAAALKDRADLATRGTVELFGRPTAIGDGPLPWHKDVTTGASWDPATWFADIRWGAGRDVRVPWELSRCGHFVTLGQAYVLTGDERFAKTFSDQLEDWIRRNPPKFGVNWAVAMEVALRACNWLAAWELFSRSSSLSPFVREHFAGALWEHGRHIEAHLEWAGEVSTNHYLGGLLGLFYIGRALGQEDWTASAEEGLKAAIREQTYADGMDFEASTAYHRFVLEIFFYFARVRDGAAPAAGKGFPERLRAMFRMAAALAAPNGRTPLIGDNDSARVHRWSNRADDDMGYLGDFAAAFLADQESRAGGTPVGSETAWLFGCDAAGAMSPVGFPPTRVPNLRPGPSGIATLRGTRDAAWFLMMPNGTRGIGNHTHNDKLSVLISVGADDFLVDPGNAAYSGDPSRRDRYRSTRFHSTVMVDGAEQNRFPRQNLFTLVDDSRLQLEEFREATHVAALHTGYRRLASPVTHRRSLERVRSPLSWIIEDTLSGDGPHQALWTFVCGPSIRATVAEDGTARLDGTEGTLEIRSHAALRFSAEPGEVSPGYGAAVPTTFLRAVWKGRLPFRATFTLVWNEHTPAKEP